MTPREKLLLGVLGVVAATGGFMIPRGIRNNNPGNLMDVGIKWRGLVGRDANGYAIFDRALNGIRAMYIDLRTGFVRDGEDTVREILTEYAPPNENPTERYIDFVTGKLNVGPDEIMNLTQVRVPLLKALIEFENGRQPYTDEIINQAIAAA